MTVIDQARRYVQAIPGAIQGQEGSTQAYVAAVALVNGFALDRSDALSIFREYNLRCVPPWSEKEMEHKISQAIEKPHDKPRGHLIGSRKAAGASGYRPSSTHVPPVKASPAPAVTQRHIEIDTGITLPDPIPDGTRELLRAVFRQGEGVGIAKAVLNDAGKEVPVDGGTCLSREAWLAKLDEHAGKPNSLFYSAKSKTGIYIRINPLVIGGAKDDDITDYRHALIEFDNIKPEAQYGLYLASRLPCAAIIRSGGKSIHAWVRVGAADKAEYDERVKFIHAYLESAGFKCDPQNKNPSRFSRLPNCHRFTSRQELLRLNVGAATYGEWFSEIESAGIGTTSTIGSLLKIKIEDDPTCLLGKRYLCKRGAWLITGPSGVGKSSLAVQCAILWAMGLPAFGITPTKPLKSMFYQAENDDGDLAEMVRGVLDGLNVDQLFETSAFDMACANVVFVSDPTRTGPEFLRAVHCQIDKHKPDLVWMDPAAAFVGDDIGRQTTIAEFFRKGLGGIAHATNVTWMIINHTTKPPTDAKARSGWTSSDHQYSGAGSYDLPGWARAVCNLRQVNERDFELKLTKRGKRACATHPDGSPALSIWLRHAEKGIIWQQVAPPDEQPYVPKEKAVKEPKKSKVEILAGKNLHDVLSKIPADGETANSLGERFHDFSLANGHNIAKSSCRGDLLCLLVEREKLSYDPATKKYLKGKNA
jgi:RecA-family ATPase